MTGEDGKKKWFIDRNFVLIVSFIILFIICVLIYSNHHRPVAYQNCAQIRVNTGRSYIKAGDPLYQRRLDREGNGIACEQ